MRGVPTLILVLISVTFIPASSQTFNWGVVGTGGGRCRGAAVAADSAGNLILVGTFEGDLASPTRFADLELSPGGRDDAYVVKVDRNGAPLWARVLGAGGFDRAAGVCTDRAGNIYVAGVLDRIRIPDTAQTTRSLGFLASYTPDGTRRWVMVDTPAQASVYNAVACDRNDDIVVVGTESTAAPHALIAKYSAGGARTWRTIAAGAGASRGTCVGLDMQGGILFGGMARDSVAFDTVSVAAAGSRNAFVVAKYGPEGRVRWVRTAPNPRDGETAQAIAVDGEGRSYLMTTGFWRRGIVTVTDAAGHEVWTREYGGVLGGICVEPSGAWYLAASAKQGDTLDTIVMNEDPGTDPVYGFLVVARFTRDGAVTWARGGGGSKVQVGTAVVLDRDGMPAVGGWFGDDGAGQDSAVFGSVALHGFGSSSALLVHVTGGSSSVDVPRAATGARRGAAYPNPTTGIVHIPWSVGHTDVLCVQLSDALGGNRRSFRWMYDAGSASIVLDLTGLPAGVYYCRARHAAGTLTAPIIVSR